MPAIDLMSDQANIADYPVEKQKALFKLWLILTTEPFNVSSYTTICQTTADADAFIERTKDIEAPRYFIDLEKLSPQLQPLKPEAVTQAFDLLNDSASRQMLQDASSQFHQLGSTGDTDLGYGTVACTAIKRIIDVDQA